MNSMHIWQRFKG